MRKPLMLALALGLAAAACESPTAADLAGSSPSARGDAHPVPAGPITLDAPIYGIAAAPDGSLLAAHGNQVLAIRKGGVETVAEVSLPDVSPAPGLNGVASNGRGSLLATSGGGDLAVGAALWQVSNGRARMVGDIHSYVTANEPDITQGPAWNHEVCNADAVFSPGPASNPYHLTRLHGGAALVADAAGNSLLRVGPDGRIDWVAVFTPPVDGGTSGDPPDWASTDDVDWVPLDTRTTAAGDVDCYAQPVPTSVTIGPDGAIYVGELNGSSQTQPLGATGLARVWRIEPGARHVTCPSSACQPVLWGLTTVIDLAFGPDGALYVAEYDFNGWIAPFASVSHGDLLRCDVDAHTCEGIDGYDDVTLPSALAFDKRGALWLLTDNVGVAGGPTLERVEMD